MTLAVVMPVFEDVKATAQLVRNLGATLGPDVFIVAVDDGSVTQPLTPVAIAEAGLKGVIIKIKRNVGHQRAIAVGIGHVAATMPKATCVVMDCDGEDKPESVPELLAALNDDGVDVVVAKRASRIETLRFKIFYLIYRYLFLALTGREIAFGNFMALKPKATQRLAQMQEVWTHVAASVIASKLRVRPIPIHRGPRYVGQSRMNFASLVLHGFRAFTVFAEDVLVRVGLACVVVIALSVLGILASILLKFLGMATPGWFSLALGVLVLIVFQTGTLTLISLMLAGIARNSNLTAIDYRSLIDEILPLP